MFWKEKYCFRILIFVNLHTLLDPCTVFCKIGLEATCVNTCVRVTQIEMSTMDEIEEEAKAAAEKMVMNMMQRPGQLEKVCKQLLSQVFIHTWRYSQEEQKFFSCAAENSQQLHLKTFMVQGKKPFMF